MRFLERLRAGVGLGALQASVFLWPCPLGPLILRRRDARGPAPSILAGGGEAKNP